MNIQFLGATGEVTGSCHLLTVGGRRILLDCGLFQGGREDEARNLAPFPFDPASLDAVVLSHAHIDHSGRLPLLIKHGFTGPVYTHHASRDLCSVMLRDAAFIHEKEVEWVNRKRERKGLKPLEPVYTRADAQRAMRSFEGLAYGEVREILPGVQLRLYDAGHILGSAIVELRLREQGQESVLVFSGDLGQPGADILHDPARVAEADVLLLESTYGDRLHRSREDTLAEMHEVLDLALGGRGNVLIPAFAVGRTQELLHLFGEFFAQWGLARWQVFLDSPLAIEATEIYLKHSELFDAKAREMFARDRKLPVLPNLHLTRTPAQSMALNRIHSGAIIIAGSGMCTGGRIKQHLKHNVWRRDCHVVIVGYQAHGTLGRQLVDGARHIRLWGETIQVNARIHTLGGFSAHADQRALTDWLETIRVPGEPMQGGRRPQVVLVHGEPEAQRVLAAHLRARHGLEPRIAVRGESLSLPSRPVAH
ncbi:MAG: hypothetical protein RL434_1391 [Pseudomonadota bacterium]|jgi:metallo-beta-lactamase family protein